MGFLPNLRKKVKKAVNKVTTVKNKVLTSPIVSKVKSKTVGAVKNKLINAAQSKGFIVLAPYKQVMRAILKKRGHATSNSASIKNITLLFYDAVILGRKNFNYSHYSGARVQHVEATDVLASGGSIALSAASGGVIPPAATKKIIEAILNWFKNIGKKKSEGQALTQEETMAEVADKEIEEKGEVVGVDRPNFFVRLMRSIFGSKKENFRRRIDARNRKTMVSNLPKNSTVTIPKNIPTNLPVNATELGYAITKANTMQSFGTMSANSLVNITPNIGNTSLVKKKPNTYYKGKGWTDHKGRLI